MKILIITVIILFAPLANADTDLDYFSFTLENDFFVRDDGLYSSGLIGSWGYDDVQRLDQQSLPNWLAYLAQKSYLNAQQGKNYNITYSVAQLLQTAIEITAEELVEEDAPYVGLLAWQGKLSAYDQATIDRLSLTLGAVGPIAGAKFTQDLVHYLIGANEPKGWEHQIGNEFIFRLESQRLWRVYSKNLNNYEFDLITGVNGGVGNLRSDLAAGMGVRWGRDLQRNFSSASVFPIQKLNRTDNSANGWYLFANTSAFYVANDIFINGNTFQESHSVDLIHQQFGFSAGVMANIADWSFLYTLLHLTDQYHGQNEHSRFGSLTVTYHF